jgi:hypothetical protein
VHALKIFEDLHPGEELPSFARRTTCPRLGEGVDHVHDPDFFAYSRTSSF